MLTRRNFLKIAGSATLGSLLISQVPVQNSVLAHTLNQSPYRTMNQTTEAVILMSAPSINERYYREFFDDLLAFYARLVEASHPNDIPLIVADRATEPYLYEVVPEENVVVGTIPDVWIRDFAPIRTAAGNFDFQYAPQYLSWSDARYVERGFNRWFRGTGLSKINMRLILDGGNFNYNGVDSAVMTERILADNPSYSRNKITKMLKKGLGLSNVAIIPEYPGELTGHSDGMVKWLAPSKLGVAQLEEPLQSQILAELTDALSNVELIEIPTVVHDEQWGEWGSVKGLYVNALTTANAIYVPMFGLAEDDEALAIFRQHAAKPVISVQVGREVNMGGSVRCLTWQLDGADAQNLLAYYDDIYASGRQSDSEVDETGHRQGEFSLYLPIVSSDQ